MIDKFDGTYRWLSNFWPTRVWLSDESYPSVEHAYQAAKTVNKQEREQFQLPISSSAAKRLGRTVTMRADWDKVKLDIMLNLLQQKFKTPEMAALLLATGDEELIEGNWWNDMFWGICRGQGYNHLGCLLMQVRTQLQQETQHGESRTDA